MQSGYAQQSGGGNYPTGNGVRVKEVDGSPNVPATQTLVFPNGSLTRAGQTVTVTFSGGTEISQANVTDRTSTTAGAITGRRAYDAINRWAPAIHAAAKVAHGFAVLDPIYNDAAGIWQKALATGVSTLPTGIVTKVVDADNFEYATAEGEFTFTAHGLSTGSVYYLQNAGGIGTSPGTVSYIVGAPTGANTFQYYGVRPTSGLTVGSTTISSGNATRLVYETSGNLLGEISGATSDGTNVTFGSTILRATSPRVTTDLSDSNGNELFKFTATGSAVNEFTVANAATGAAPTLSATGGDTNIDFNVAAKGSGVLISGSKLKFSSASYGNFIYSSNASAGFGFSLGNPVMFSTAGTEGAAVVGVNYEGSTKTVFAATVLHLTGVGSAPSGTGATTFLQSDAAEILASRNGTNAQTHRIYNTYTSSTNYERAALGWSSNQFFVATEKGSSGNARELVLGQTIAQTRLRTSLATPGTPADGDWWVECTGTTPSRVCAVKVQDGGSTRTIASLTY